MRLQDNYDWVVLGDHPGSLLSAGLASQLGYSVLVLPLTPSVLSSVSSTGQCLDPETNYVLGLSRFGSSIGLLAECINQIGGSPFTPKLVKSGQSVAPQVVTHGTRLSLGLEDEELFRELEREFGPDVAKSSGLIHALDHAEDRAVDFWKTFPLALAQSSQKKKNWAERRRANALSQSPLISLYQALRAGRDEKVRSMKGPSRVWLKAADSLSEVWSEVISVRSKKKTKKSSGEARLAQEQLRVDFKETLEGLWNAVSGTDFVAPKPIDVVHLMALARTAGSFRGGMSAYRRFLSGLAQRLGAQIPVGLECRRIFVEDGKLMGIQLADKGKMIGVKAGIVGCALSQAKEFVSFSGRASSAGLKLGSTPQGWRFTVALTVHAEAIPEGISNRLVWREPGSPLLEIEIADPEDYELGPSDTKLIFLRTGMPFTSESLQVSFQRLMAARMFRQLCLIFPFLEFHVTRVYPDFRHAETSSKDEFSEVYGFVSPEFIPDNIRTYGTDGGGAGLGYSTGVKGLFVANGESYPSMGMFGASVAAIQAIFAFASQGGGTSAEKLKDYWSFLE